MKTTGKFSASSALYVMVSVFWYLNWIVGGAHIAFAIWLVTTHSGSEIVAVMDSEETLGALRWFIYTSLIWLKSNPWVSMLISTIGHASGWVIGLWLINHLRKLVRNIQSNQIYSTENMTHSRMVGLGIFGIILVDAIFKKHWSWMTLFLALIALVFVEILRRGIALVEEQKYTI